MKNILTGQNYRYGFYELSPQERMDCIKRAGFDEVMFWWGDEYDQTDGTRFELFDYATKIGLLSHTAHFPTTHSEFLWMDGEEGQSFVNQFVAACRECGERGISFLVTHMTRKFCTPDPNEIGLANFERMLDAAQKHGVIIAVENSRFLHYIDYIVEHFGQHPALGFCFDCGHANCFTPNESPLERFGKYLVTTHIHDNDGPGDAVDTRTNPSARDQHRTMGEGNVNYDRIFAELKQLNNKYYNLESKCSRYCDYYGKTTAQEFLDISYQKLVAQLQKSGIGR